MTSEEDKIAYLEGLVKRERKQRAMHITLINAQAMMIVGLLRGEVEGLVELLRGEVEG